MKPSIEIDQPQQPSTLQSVAMFIDKADASLEALAASASNAGRCVQMCQPKADTAPLESPVEVIIIGCVQAHSLKCLPECWTKLDSSITPNTLVLVNALGMTATECSHILGRPVIAFSPFALYQGKQVIELAKPHSAEASYFQAARLFFESLDYAVIEVPDTPAMILARTVAMLVNEAASALMSGVASVEDIDTAMRYGTNYPHGPLTWADTVGVDVIYHVLSHLHRVTGEERYRPMPLLREMALTPGARFYVETVN